MNAPKEVALGFAELGVKKAQTPKGKAFLLAILAGMFIAFAGVAATIGNAAAGKLAGACIFPAGLAMVVVAGSELFTGDNLMIVSLMEKKITAGQLIATLAVVYIGNLLGSILVAALASLGGSMNAVQEAVVSTAAAKVSMGFGEALVRGVMCNILVCIAVWMAAAAKTVPGKIIGLYMPIMVFVLCGYEHCVANMYYIPAGIFTAARYGLDAGGVTWGAFFLKNLLPVTLGNLIGGMGVGIVYRTIYLTEKAKQTV